ncbi:MAG: hypothetical protein F6K30_18550 [Cyanothece sp. SIO2G6]|nr:hypothetical protein [Cyanothece sp. SIO2G6]
MSILDVEQSYTFSQLGKLTVPTDDLLAEFGYGFSRRHIPLPQVTADLIGALDQITATRQRIDRILPLADLANETSRRETLIAPVITDIAITTQAQLRIEYAIAVSNWLQGIFNYFLFKSSGPLLVVAAKQEDLTKGFNQMAVELIALDQWTKSPTVDQYPTLFGAVTTGDIWRFGCLERTDKHVSQHLSLYRVPEDLESVERILIGILLAESESIKP